MASQNLLQLTTDFMKLERFDGGNFRRWQKKVRFLLLTLAVDYVLTTPKPQERENETLAESRARTKWGKDDERCRGHILNALADNLLRASEATSTSTTSLCANLASLKDLHVGINNMTKMPSIQQAFSHEQCQNWINELLKGSLRLVDLCEFSRDIVCLTKESVQDLESSIRRNGALTDNEFETMLKETEALDFLVLSSVLMLISGENGRSKQRSLSFLSKFTKTSRIHSEIDDLCSFDIQEVEEGLESLFRNLIKTRVSLLNVLSH
ncbi:hypothetical protein BUALT_Bualt08G0098800 [Buddleja alternifolia]|uniref:Uncharacterized protein n=1 Tax=Buddleja alternifolia TaxID=168488 RepID=A0AAV6XG64_9LAMI|nr:hypothetical protein BUALT_Bualt08G0098800 [Buddleja alternifolia]